MFRGIDFKNFKVLDVIQGCAEAYLEDIDSKPEAVKNVIKYRLTLCNGCELNEDGWCNTDKTIVDLKTGKPVKGCGCNLKCKTALLRSHCPAHKWDSVKL